MNRGSVTPEDRLRDVVGEEKVRTALLDRVAYSCDASLYQLIPRAVVYARSIDDIRTIFAWSQREQIPITFRAAGTSLSGQAVTNHVLVSVERGFEQLEIVDHGNLVRAGCSLRGGYVNARLRPYQRRIGPDPASIDACTIGGIVANNASGMCCGIAQNAYHTLRAMTIVLPSGTILDTSDLDAADAVLAHSEPRLWEGLQTLRQYVLCSEDLVRVIRHRSRLKNTMGYSLAALLDFERPSDILQHLLVGSEGTLAFIADVTFATIPQPPYATTAFVEFATLTTACRAVERFAREGAVAIELMDAATLRAIRSHSLHGAMLGDATSVGLLVEFQYDEPTIETHIRNAIKAISSDASAVYLRIAENEQERASLWHLRKGAMPSVGAARRVETTLINEDVAFPRAVLAPAVEDLQQLLYRHGFDDAVIFGHARDGNMHFAFSLRTDKQSIERYGVFIDELAELVVSRYDGSLKAEHSTGRNMAPYLETQWGRQAVELMWRIKELFDPDHLLNPDVILTRDRALHLHNIKQLPAVDYQIDTCIECGFCERTCPSTGLTLSPRQRIVVAREIVRCSQRNDQVSVRALLHDFRYAGIQTCAADGLCKHYCPVGINTGAWVIPQRARHISKLESVLWTCAAKNPGSAITTIGTTLTILDFISRVVGPQRLEKLSAWWGRWLRLPTWIATVGTPERRVQKQCVMPLFVFMPSCMAWFGGRQRYGLSYTEVFLTLAERLGQDVAIAQQARRVCCGHPLHSRGMDDEFGQCFARWFEAAMHASHGGSIPIVLDSSSCALTIKEVLRTEKYRRCQLTVLDPVEVIEKWLVLLRDRINKTWEVLFHPPCSLVNQGLVERTSNALAQLGCLVIMPDSAGCCGMAGDRGLVYPELPSNALLREKNEINQSQADFFVTTNLPCQWMLTHISGKPFTSLWHAIEQMTR